MLLFRSISSIINLQLVQFSKFACVFCQTSTLLRVHMIESFIHILLEIFDTLCLLLLLSLSISIEQILILICDMIQERLFQFEYKTVLFMFSKCKVFTKYMLQNMFLKILSFLFSRYFTIVSNLLELKNTDVDKLYSF